MKKYLALFLALLMVLSLCACGSGSGSGSGSAKSPATIETNDGETIEKTFEELLEEYDGNSVSFGNKYMGASVSFVGTVESVSESYQDAMKVRLQKITFVEGAELWLLAGAHDDVVNVITKGSKVTVTSDISGANGFVVYLNDLHGVGSSMADKSTISVVE